jgi:hypothetical protein
MAGFTPQTTIGGPLDRSDRGLERQQPLLLVAKQLRVGDDPPRMGSTPGKLLVGPDTTESAPFPAREARLADLSGKLFDLVEILHLLPLHETDQQRLDVIRSNFVGDDETPRPMELGAVPPRANSAASSRSQRRPQKACVHQMDTLRDRPVSFAIRRKLTPSARSCRTCSKRSRRTCRLACRACSFGDSGEVGEREGDSGKAGAATGADESAGTFSFDSSSAMEQHVSASSGGGDAIGSAGVCEVGVTVESTLSVEASSVGFLSVRASRTMPVFLASTRSTASRMFLSKCQRSATCNACGAADEAALAKAAQRSRVMTSTPGCYSSHFLSASPSRLGSRSTMRPRSRSITIVP